MLRLIRHDSIFGARRSSRSKRRPSSREITDHLVRCKSSNVWAYAFDIQEDSNIGTLYIQFKDVAGGPGDIYRYYEVPLRVYQRFISGPSKGHSFWKLIRNQVQYSKLTGDKKGKLRNAVN